MWLMRQSLAEAIENARAQALEAPKAVSEAFDRSIVAGALGEPRIFKRAGDVAQIDIVGVLTPKPDYYAYWFGGGNTTYPEIQQSLQLAAADAGIKRVVLNISSPGGYVSGLFDVLGSLEAFKKAKETRAAQADSAAYAIAALGGKITATNKAAEFGSVGVCATFVRYDGMNIYEITSSNAPDKRPDPSTKEGQAVIRAGLDAIEELFVDAIARGRNTSVKDVTKNFGRGAVLLAGAALELGMIDAIDGSALRSDTVSTDSKEPTDNTDPADGEDEAASASRPKQVSVPVQFSVEITPSIQVSGEKPTAQNPPAPSAPPKDATANVLGGAATKDRKIMDEKTLQEQHPGLYAAVFNKGKAEGKTEAETAAKDAAAEEKDRVEAHLTAGEESGDMKTAIGSIRSGAKMTQTLMAKYMMAGMRKGAVDARSEDDKTAEDATSGAAGNGDKGKSLKDQIADEIEAQTKGAPNAAA